MGELHENLQFETPTHSLADLRVKLSEYQAKSEFPHDVYAIVCIEEGIRSAEMGNIGVGACLVKEGKILYRDVTKHLYPYPRTDLHAEMVVLNTLEDRICDQENPRMRDYTLFSMQEPCVLCTMRLIFSQVGKTYWVYRDAHSHEGGDTTNFDRQTEALKWLASRLVFDEADCSPELKEVARQVFLNSTSGAVAKFLSRY